MLAGIDTRGMASRVCLNCGGDVFKILAKFDEDSDICWYTMNGYCHQCHAPVTVPSPIDTVEQMVMEFDDEY